MGGDAGGLLILDQFGRPVAALKKPELRELAAVSLRDRWSSYPSRGLTPGRLSAILEAADAGTLREQAELFEEMEEKDAHLAAVLQSRRLAVVGLPWQVTPAAGEKPEQAAAELCREVLESLNIRELCLHLLDAVGKGVAAVELVWQVDGGRAVVSRARPIHAKNITWLDSDTPRLVTEANWQGEEVPPWKWIVHVHRTRSGHDTRNGVLRVCAYMYLFKNYALKDWAVFNEIFGMPLRLGKYDPAASPADREALRAAISSLGSDAAGIISKNTEIEFVEAAGRLSGTYNPYEVLAEFCNREMSKAVLGQTLTTDTTRATGTYAVGRVHDEVRRDLLEADAAALAETLRAQLLRPLTGFNFGWEVPAPRFRFDLAEEVDLKALAETYKILHEMGQPLSVEHVAERFGVPLPEPGAELVGGGGAMAAARRWIGTGELVPLQALGPEAALQGEADGAVVRAQEDLERLTGKALGAAGPAAARLREAILGLVREAGSLEEARGRLLHGLAGLAAPVAELAELLHRAQMLAWIKGRVQ